MIQELYIFKMHVDVSVLLEFSVRPSLNFTNNTEDTIEADILHRRT